MWRVNTRTNKMHGLARQPGLRFALNEGSMSSLITVWHSVSGWGGTKRSLGWTRSVKEPLGGRALRPKILCYNLRSPVQHQASCYRPVILSMSLASMIPEAARRMLSARLGPLGRLIHLLMSACCRFRQLPLQGWSCQYLLNASGDGLRATATVLPATRIAFVQPVTLYNATRGRAYHSPTIDSLLRRRCRRGHPCSRDSRLPRSQARAVARIHRLQRHVRYSPTTYPHSRHTAH